MQRSRIVLPGKPQGPGTECCVQRHREVAHEAYTGVVQAVMPSGVKGLSPDKPFFCGGRASMRKRRQHPLLATRGAPTGSVTTACTKARFRNVRDLPEVGPFHSDRGPQLSSKASLPSSRRFFWQKSDVSTVAGKRGNARGARGDTESGPFHVSPTGPHSGAVSWVCATGMDTLGCPRGFGDWSQASQLDAPLQRSKPAAGILRARRFQSLWRRWSNEVSIPTESGLKPQWAARLYSWRRVVPTA